VRDELLGGDVVAGHPDDRAVEQPAALQPAQPAERHPPGQVTGDTEDDQHIRGIVAVVVHQPSVVRAARPTPRAAISPAVAACTPAAASSTTKHRAGAAGSSPAATREDHRVRLAARQVAPADVRVRQVEQGEACSGDAGTQPDLPQEEAGVPGPGRGGDRDAGRRHRDDKPDRAGERHELSLFDERDQVFLPVRRAERGPAPGTGHAEVLQRGERPAQPGPPGDNLLVHGLSEPLRAAAGLAAKPGPSGVRHLPQRIAPAAAAGRADQHAADVEDGPPQRPGAVDGRRAGEDHRPPDPHADGGERTGRRPPASPARRACPPR
jgi:hypothetical protein